MSSSHAIPAVYPPLYYVMVAGLIKLGVPGYVAGRLISLSSIMGICTIIFKAVLNETRDRWIAVGSAFLFLIFPYVNASLSLMKADLLGVFFVLLGMYYTIYRPKTKPVYLAAPFVLAILTKHYYVVAPIVALCIMYLRDRRSALWFFGVLSSAVAVTFGALEFVTHGRFLTEIVFGVAAPININNIFHVLVQLSKPWSIFGALGLWGAIIAWRAGQRYWLWYLFASTLLAIYGLGKDGAAWDYFFESFTVLAVIIGIAVHHSRRTMNTYSLILVVTLLLSQIITSIPDDVYNLKNVYHGTQTKQLQKLEHIVNLSPTHVLSDVPGVAADSQNGLTIAPFEYRLLVFNHIVSDKGLVENMKTGQYGLVVASPLYQHRFTPDVLHVIDTDYIDVGTVDSFTIYAYKWLQPNVLNKITQAVSQ